jgi:hypothetical protein
MLAFHGAPAQTVESRACEGASIGLFARLRQAISEDPGLALACLGRLASEVQREYILREAFNAAVVRQPEIARPYIRLAINRPWVADAGYFPIARLAAAVMESDSQLTRKLLLAGASRHPSVALREVRNYIDLRYGREVFEAAALAAPDEAAGLAAGNSGTAEAVRNALRASSHPEIQILARLSADGSRNPIVRERLAVFAGELAAGRLSMTRATELASGNGYFPAVAKLRIEASGDRARALDRVLENNAQILFRSIEDRGGSGMAGPLKSFEARDLYLLLTYGRTEADDALFTTVFDRMLVPKMRARPPSSTASALSQLLNEVRDLNLRRFLTAAIAHNRLDAFLATAASRTEQSSLLARCVQGLETADRPLDEALAAAAIVDGAGIPYLTQLRSAVLKEYNRAQNSGDASASALYGLLAAEVARKLPESDVGADPAFRAVAAHYRGYFQEPRLLNAEALFDASGVCIQQHFFYDDEDGVESFESFKQSYTHDPAWRWEDHGTYVQITGEGSSGRRIEIFANVPTYPPAPDAKTRRHVLARMLTDRGLTPAVVVHRGHAFFFEESLRYLTPSARLVYLGSCRGLENVHSVIATASRAQIIVTRNVGTQTVNDPLLKAINDELLRGNKTLDWESFWRAQEARLGKNAMFRDYIPPTRNGAAIMLSAYYMCLANGN